MLAALALAGLGGSGTSQADPGIDDALRKQFGESTFCLPVHGALSDAGGPLRVAAPPYDAARGTAFLQGFFGGMLGEAGQRSVSNAKGAPGFLTAMMGAPSPLVTLLFDGSRDLLAGRTASAARRFGDCAALAQKQQDDLSEAACRNDLGVTRAATGQMAQARSEFERALALYGQARPRPSEQGAPAVAALQSMIAPFDPSAMVADRIKSLPPEIRAQMEVALKKQQAEAASRYESIAERMFAAAREFNSRRGSEIANLNLGNLALATGRLADAQASMRAAWDAHGADEPSSCRAGVAMDVARVDVRLNRRVQGEALVAGHQPAPRDPDNAASADVNFVELGAVGVAGSSPDGAMTAVPDPASRREPAPRPGITEVPSLTFTLEEPADRLADGALREALAKASSTQQAGAPARQVLAGWRRVALRADAANRPDLGFIAHAGLMRLHLAQGDLPAAIHEGKLAANLAQATRANLDDRSPSRDARRAFLRERRQVFVALAQALLDQERLAEAESVLQALKEDEGQQFIDRPPAAAALALNAREQARQAQESDAARRLQAAERARVAAAESVPLGGGALRSVSRRQLEALRLRLGLTLDGLPARAAARGLESPGDDPTSQAMVKDARAFFLGSPSRVEQFMHHLIEDAPRFDPPVDDRTRAQLAATLARLPEIRRQLEPLLDAPLPAGGGVRVSMRPGGSSGTSRDEPSAFGYVGAEPVERIWRQLVLGDDIEARALESPEPSLEAAPPPAAGADDTIALMARQSIPTDLLYYLTGDQRLDVLLVSAQGRRHVRVALAKADLDATIDAFVNVLKTPYSDPRAAAGAMYQRLFAPIAAAVADSGAQVIALSLDGKLRFVPFAALHDGRQWLVERYAIALNPGGALADRLKPSSPRWRVEAFGTSRPWTIGADAFVALKGVPGELEAVARQKDSESGALPGHRWPDDQFTAQRLESALAGAPAVVHIASHFKFVPGDAPASYLVLGDGHPLSLRDLAGPAYRLDRTELVTLSACGTGLSADDAYGQEVDGLAALLMGQGAASVVASLWSVDDPGTSTLMKSLYRFHEADHLSRALALQKAQKTMLAQASPGQAGGRRDVYEITESGKPVERPAASAASLGQGHPFFWAAFVLMGDWL